MNDKYKGLLAGIMTVIISTSIVASLSGCSWEEAKGSKLDTNRTYVE